MLPNVLGVSPKTCHKIIRLEIKNQIPWRDACDNIEPNKKISYCSYDALVKVKEYVSARISELLFLKPGREDVFQYKNYVRIYHNAKKKFLCTKRKVYRTTLSPEIRRLQSEITFVNAIMSGTKKKLPNSS